MFVELTSIIELLSDFIHFFFRFLQTFFLIVPKQLYRKLLESVPETSVVVHQPLSMSAIISLSVNGQETACAHMLIVAQAMLISPRPPPPPSPPPTYVGR